MSETAQASIELDPIWAWCPVCHELIDVRHPTDLPLRHRGNRYALCSMCAPTAELIIRKHGGLDVDSLREAFEQLITENNEKQFYTVEDMLNEWEEDWGPPPAAADDEDSVFQQWEDARYLAYYEEELAEKVALFATR